MHEEDGAEVETQTPETWLETAELDDEGRRAIDALLERVREAEDRLLRVEAEADNRRKRLERETQDAIRFANEGLVERLLPVFDNLEVCLDGASGASPEQLIEALQGTLGQLRETLGSIGIELITAEPGEAFDPKVHEATVQDPEADLPRNAIVRVLQDGVRYHDRLLRPVRVVVATGRG